MIKVTTAEAQAGLPELLAKAQAGESVEIQADNGRTIRLVADPVPAERKPRKAGSCKGLIEITEAFDEPVEELREYCG